MSESSSNNDTFAMTTSWVLSTLLPDDVFLPPFTEIKQPERSERHTNQNDILSHTGMKKLIFFFRIKILNRTLALLQLPKSMPGDGWAQLNTRRCKYAQPSAPCRNIPGHTSFPPRQERFTYNQSLNFKKVKKL